MVTVHPQLKLIYEFNKCIQNRRRFRLVALRNGK